MHVCVCMLTQLVSLLYSTASGSCISSCKSLPIFKNKIDISIFAFAKTLADMIVSTV